jgi:uncharacterized membrane protein
VKEVLIRIAITIAIIAGVIAAVLLFTRFVFIIVPLLIGLTLFSLVLCTVSDARNSAGHYL